MMACGSRDSTSGNPPKVRGTGWEQLGTEYQSNRTMDGQRVGVGGNCRVLPQARNGRWRDLAAGRWLLDVGAQRIRYFPCDVHHHSSRVFTPWWRVRHWPHWQASSGCLRGNRALGGVVRLPPPPRPLHAAGVVLYHGCAGGWRAWGCGRARRGVTGARGRAARRAVLILRVW